MALCVHPFVWGKLIAVVRDLWQSENVGFWPLLIALCCRVIPHGADFITHPCLSSAAVVIGRLAGMRLSRRVVV